jgi:hypothetical protein
MRAVMLFMVAALLAGCAGYKLGPSNGLPAGSRSVEVRTFVNKTKEPRISEYLAASLRKHFQQDGSYRLETSGRGDILIMGEITGFDRGGLAYQPNDVLTPQEYTLMLTAHVVAVNVNTGKTNFSQNVLGRAYIRVGTDQSSAEREAIPLLTDDLARNAVSFVVDGDW